MTPVYEAAALTKLYGRKTALNNVSFTVEAGRLVGLLGPNGSGKTTLLKISAGLLTPTVGLVRIAGNQPGPATKAVTSYLPDRMALPTEFRVDDAVAFYHDFFLDFDAAKADAMLRDLKLEPKQRISAMSKGTQEKMQLCLTMSRAAKLYLLDEPLGGVDPAAREYILNTILRNYSEDAAVVISTHLIEDIETALDEVLLLREGSLLAHQNVDALREESGKSLDEYFREVFRC
ncbi:MAG TPA: ABC transporter ATP-binding protein [Candidatus Gemmiger avicola]|uniref:ABC transporter ATP-binding protein n=1 Tax=Candidatus Gemmiger avicola TaxID=2838605 RepID=A0A9D2M619_9FIRM|nr:ABC transporter ATP-binding protein [Candidatus Gemmiger avicola]